MMGYITTYLRHREDTIKLFYEDVAKCAPPFTTIAAGSDARNEPRSRLSLQRLTFPSSSVSSSRPRSVCDSLFLTLSHCRGRAAEMSDV